MPHNLIHIYIYENLINGKVYIGRRGIPKSEEHKKKLAAAKLGRKQSAEHVKNAVNARIGMKQSDIHKQRRAAAMKGKKPSQATRDKWSKMRKGIVCKEAADFCRGKTWKLNVDGKRVWLEVSDAT